MYVHMYAITRGQNYLFCVPNKSLTYSMNFDEFIDFSRSHCLPCKIWDNIVQWPGAQSLESD